VRVYKPQDLPAFTGKTEREFEQFFQNTLLPIYRKTNYRMGSKNRAASQWPSNRYRVRIDEDGKIKRKKVKLNVIK
jgi:hypothetical protein